MRIGLDNIMGYVPSTAAFVTAGGVLNTTNIIDINTLKAKLNDPNVQVVDLRGATEYKSGHIAGADPIFVGTLPKNLDKVSREKEVIVLCQGGDRATIGYSLLENAGYTNILNYAPSMNEWIAQGNPTVN